jgi:hypothetical protein
MVKGRNQSSIGENISAEGDLVQQATVAFIWDTTAQL